jgi:magnesium-transporting ATPase (P-type)
MIAAEFKLSSREREGVVAMQQMFNQLLQFLQQGIAAIIRFVQLIWSWSTGQIVKVFTAPWQNWPLWKQLVLVLVAGVIVYVLYKAIKELWETGERALGAFTSLLGAFVKTLPRILIAGLVALGGIWLLNNFDPSSIRLPAAPQLSKG